MHSGARSDVVSRHAARARARSSSRAAPVRTARAALGARRVSAPRDDSRAVRQARAPARTGTPRAHEPAELALAAMRATSMRTGSSILLGHGSTGWAWAGREHSTLVLGPSRSGKTSSIIVPNVLVAGGAVVATSTKPDVLRHSAPTRRAAGWCLLFDPTGTVDAPAGVQRVGWSPISGALDWGGALTVADAMVRTSRTQHRGGSFATGDHWTERASALMATLLHAAALERRPMRDVLRWVDRHDGAPALDVLSAHPHQSSVPTDLLAGILSTDARELSGIWSTTSGVLAAYRSPGALAATEPPFLDADTFCESANTLYVCAPAARQQLLAPLVVGLITEIRDAAYRRAAIGPPGRTVPVLFALDEVANIAPLPDLPSLVTEGPGQGLLTLACLQDLSQARGRWGPDADAFLSIFSTTLVLGGIADMRTLDAISRLAGDREVATRTVSASRGPGGHQASSSVATTWRPRLPPDVIARGEEGWALALDARKRTGWVRLAPAHETWPWRTLVDTGRARLRVDQARRTPGAHPGRGIDRS